MSANIRATITTNGIGVERAKELAKSEKWKKLTKKISPQLEVRTLLMIAITEELAKATDETTNDEMADEAIKRVESIKQVQKKAFKKFKRNFEKIPEYQVYLEDFLE